MCLTKRTFLLFFSIAVIFSCQNGNDHLDDDVHLLAEVSGRKLYTTDLKEVLPQDLDTQDSILYVQRLVERWARDQVLLIEAENKLPSDINMQTLLRDYRSSLLLNNFEAKLVETYLDNNVNALELQTYYDAHKELFTLESPIIRCQFIKIKKSYDDIDKVRKWWNSSKEEDFKLMKLYADEYAETAMLNDQEWHLTSDILDELPPEILDPLRLTTKKDISLTGDEYFYFLRVIEIVLKKEIAPLAFVEDKARKVILHRRKNLLLEKLKKDFYSKAIEENRVKIYL